MKIDILTAEIGGMMMIVDQGEKRIAEGKVIEKQKMNEEETE